VLGSPELDCIVVGVDSGWKGFITNKGKGKEQVYHRVLVSGLNLACGGKL